MEFDILVKEGITLDRQKTELSPVLVKTQYKNDQKIDIHKRMNIYL